MDFAAIQQWFLSLGEQYGVNPLIFGGIYVGAIPFFTISISFLVRNIRQKKPFIVPLLFAGFFFVSAYLYLIIAGKNVPLWVYIFIVGLVLFGAYTTYKKVVKKIEDNSWLSK